jgi:hypothetical protein
MLLVLSQIVNNSSKFNFNYSIVNRFAILLLYFGFLLLLFYQITSYIFERLNHSDKMRFEIIMDFKSFCNIFDYNLTNVGFDLT